MFAHSPQSATGTIPLDSESSKGHQISKLGYARTGSSTADFLDRIDVDDDEVMGELEMCPTVSHGDLWGRYKSLVEQLPTRECIVRLTDFYFQKINWQYYVLDESSFRQQLHAWYRLDLQSSAAEKFEALPADVKAFPALLLEVAATSLLLITPDRALELDGLKHIGSTSFETMAVKYSETGMAMLNLLGKTQISLTTVFADFLRVAFLKYFGQVTEAVSSFRQETDVPGFVLAYTPVVARPGRRHQRCTGDRVASSQSRSKASHGRYCDSIREPKEYSGSSETLDASIWLGYSHGYGSWTACGY